MKTEHITNATLEAIYWWNRDESYYHDYFSRLDLISKDAELLEFFRVKVFDVFLREYSIRRNLSSGSHTIDRFINSLIKYDFFNSVKNGKVEIVDDVSGKIKNTKISKRREVRSLLSKVAYLINPKDFSLYDNQAKQSLWSILKEKKSIYKKDLDSYSIFIKEVNKLINDNKQKLNSAYVTLDLFKNTAAFHFYTNDRDAFIRRVFDKYLWIKYIIDNGGDVNNAKYLKFLKLVDRD